MSLFSPKQQGVWLAGALTVAGIVGAASSASAIPAFARKYQTSCQTCHIMFPKLNAFGEAFRLAGYRMPGETPGMVKIPPIPLGAPAYKQLWPKAVWPGAIDSVPPFAMNIQFADHNESDLNPNGSVTNILNDFQFPTEANIFAGGTLGDHVSYLSEVTFGQNPDGSVDVELEHASLNFDSPFGPHDLFHFRIGKISPNLTDGFNEMWISTDSPINSVFAYDPIGAQGGVGLAPDSISPTPISLPTLVRGIEAYGIIDHRILYVAGVASGISPGVNRFDGNNAKDVYARLDYKIGGMGLDGYEKGNPPVDSWQDNSLRLGVFVYRGDGAGIDFASSDLLGAPINIQDTKYLRTGLYGSWFIGNLNVFGVYMHGTDTLRLLQPANDTFISQLSPGYDAWFTQGDYMILPWLQGTFRYEDLKPGDPTVPSLRTAVLNASMLIRANVKFMLEYVRDLRQGQNHSFDAIVRFAF
ncbi:MAG TPA: hypothetical protein VNE16_14930 [Vicinamibacterales bacterium]|nr:hypothetical protein [Vicinamibacterales bacterium]